MHQASVRVSVNGSVALQRMSLCVRINHLGQIVLATEDGSRHNLEPEDTAIASRHAIAQQLRVAYSQERLSVDRGCSD